MMISMTSNIPIPIPIQVDMLSPAVRTGMGVVSAAACPAPQTTDTIPGTINNALDPNRDSADLALPFIFGTSLVTTRDI